jgi:hypothetical protein
MEDICAGWTNKALYKDKKTGDKVTYYFKLLPAGDL